MHSKDCGWKRLLKILKKDAEKRSHTIMGNQSTVEPLLTRPPLKPHVPKEVLGSFEVSHIVVNKLRIIWFKKINIFLYIRAFWQRLVVNWMRKGRNSASSFAHIM